MEIIEPGEKSNSLLLRRSFIAPKKPVYGAVWGNEVRYEVTDSEEEVHDFKLESGMNHESEGK